VLLVQSAQAPSEAKRGDEVKQGDGSTSREARVARLSGAVSPSAASATAAGTSSASAISGTTPASAGASASAGPVTVPSTKNPMFTRAMVAASTSSWDADEFEKKLPRRGRYGKVLEAFPPETAEEKLFHAWVVALIAGVCTGIVCLVVFLT
jgi:hypothetical protein